MSIDIDWDSLTTGPSGQDLADSIRDFIHDKFQQVELPRFIRSVQVHSFDFGKECPIVELVDISDPLPEFYEDEDDDNSHNEEDEDHTDIDHVERRGSNNASGSMRPPPPSHLTNTTASTTSNISTKPTYIDTRLPPLHSGITTPFLSRSNTPGIPGGTSNFSYFHLPLSAGMPGTHTPLPFSPANPWGEHHRSGSPVRRHHFEQQQPHGYVDPDTRPSTGVSNAMSAPSHFAASESRSQFEGPPDRSQDLQTTLHISYAGSLSISLTVEILLDYPMPSFVGIPLKLQITGLTFDGVALLAYLRQLEKSTVNFCFLGAEDAKALVGGDIKGDRGNEEEGKREKHHPGDTLGGLLREIRVESEIGRQENGKQVLKNVGKVEKFVLEQVRRIFEDEFVWPSFWTFLI